MSRDYEPNCYHESLVLVTNQPSGYDPSRPHRSVWVCDRQECILDALSWVIRGTHEHAWWKPLDGEWQQDPPRRNQQ